MQYLIIYNFFDKNSNLRKSLKMENLIKTKHLSIDKRLRLISLYERNNLHFTPKRLEKL